MPLAETHMDVVAGLIVVGMPSVLLSYPAYVLSGAPAIVGSVFGCLIKSPGRRSAVALAILAAALAGCADKHWPRPATPSAQFASDSQNCARDATVVDKPSMLPGPHGTSYVDGGPRVATDKYRACMTARGYSYA